MSVFKTSLLGIIGFASVISATRYRMIDKFTQENFFANFEFMNVSDPTHGLVDYVAAPTANDDKLAGFHSNSVYLGADHTKVVEGKAGRASVRVESKKTYTRGLFIGDFLHMPEGCGTWPSFWTYGVDPAWPAAGEIDIAEGVNADIANRMTLHTSAGCRISMPADRVLEGSTLEEQDCNSNQGFNGCGQRASDPKTFGSGFNRNGGGVYAMEWTSEFIAVWVFPRDVVPAGVLDTDTPNTDAFGKPHALFVSGEGDGCNIDQHFKNHKIVINLTMCGDWAGSVWSKDPVCSVKAATCNDYVSNNPEAFNEAYWLVRSIRVFEAAPLAKRIRGSRRFT